MLHIILGFFLAFFSHGHSNNSNPNHGEQVTALDDTGGETGTIPPKRKP